VAFEIDVDDDSAFGSTIWATGEDDFTANGFSDVAEGGRCDNITYNYDAGAGIITLYTRYYWRIRFWDHKGNRGAWSATQTFIYDPSTASKYLITFDHANIDDLDVK
jgi:hypothetical protein